MLVRYFDGSADERVDVSRLSLSGGGQSVRYQPAIQVYWGSRWYDGTLPATRGNRYQFATGTRPSGSVPIGGTTGVGPVAGPRWGDTTADATPSSAVDDATEAASEGTDSAAVVSEAIDTPVVVTATVRSVAVRGAAAVIKDDAMAVVVIREVVVVAAIVVRMQRRRSGKSAART